MFGTVDIKGRLVGQIPGALLPFFAKGTVLLALELIKQNLVQSFVEVFFDARDHFFEDITVGSGRPLGFLLRFVVLENLIH